MKGKKKAVKGGPCVCYSESEPINIFLGGYGILVHLVKYNKSPIRKVSIT